MNFERPVTGETTTFLPTDIRHIPFEDFLEGFDTPTTVHEKINSIKESGVNVEWTGVAKRQDEHLTEIQNFGSFVFSKIDESPKYSEGYGPCTGILVNVVMPDGKRVSFLSHQTPHAFSSDTFITKLKEHLDYFAGQQIIPGSTKVIVFGGRTPQASKDSALTVWQYEKPMSKLSAILEEKGLLGSTTIMPPKSPNTRYASRVYYDTSEDRLYLLESEVDIARQYIN